jgi:hypothetical protein
LRGRCTRRGAGLDSPRGSLYQNVRGLVPNLLVRPQLSGWPPGWVSERSETPCPSVSRRRGRACQRAWRLSEGVCAVLGAEPYRAPSKCIRAPPGPVPTRKFNLADFGALTSRLPARRPVRHIPVGVQRCSWRRRCKICGADFGVGRQREPPMLTPRVQA